MEDIAFVFLGEDGLVIRAVGIDPELDHAARRMDRAGDETALALADVADVNDHQIRVRKLRD